MYFGISDINEYNWENFVKVGVKRQFYGEVTLMKIVFVKQRLYSA